MKTPYGNGHETGALLRSLARGFGNDSLINLKLNGSL
jgi:hypothetical protein